MYAITVIVHGAGYEVIFLLGNELSGQTGVIRFTKSCAIYTRTRLVINLSSIPRIEGDFNDFFFIHLPQISHDSARTIGGTE